MTRPCKLLIKFEEKKEKNNCHVWSKKSSVVTWQTIDFYKTKFLPWSSEHLKGLRQACLEDLLDEEAYHIIIICGNWKVWWFVSWPIQDCSIHTQDTLIGDHLKKNLNCKISCAYFFDGTVVKCWTCNIGAVGSSLVMSKVIWLFIFGMKFFWHQNTIRSPLSLPSSHDFRIWEHIWLLLSPRCCKTGMCDRIMLN